MAFDFKKVGVKASKEIRFKIPTGLAEEYESGRKKLKELGVEVNINDEVVKLITKANAEIQAYIKANESQEQEEGNKTSSPQNTPGVNLT